MKKKNKQNKYYCPVCKEITDYNKPFCLKCDSFIGYW
jgi:hypothetical protein